MWAYAGKSGGYCKATTAQAYESGLRAANRLGATDAFRARVAQLIAGNEGFLKSVLMRRL